MKCFSNGIFFPPNTYPMNKFIEQKRLFHEHSVNNLFELKCQLYITSFVLKMTEEEIFVISLKKDPTENESDMVCRLCQAKDQTLLNVYNIERMAEKLHIFLQIEVFQN